MKRILVATDGSAAALEAEQFGIELAAESGAELVFVHAVPLLDVVPAPAFGITGAFPHEPTPFDRELLDAASQRAAEAGVIASTALLTGDVVGEIVAYADAHDADLTVVGTRGHGAIANALLGSVSHGVIRESKRPVVIVRPSVSVPAREKVGLGL